MAEKLYLCHKNQQLSRSYILCTDWVFYLLFADLIKMVTDNLGALRDVGAEDEDLDLIHDVINEPKNASMQEVSFIYRLTSKRSSYFLHGHNKFPNQSH